jgi:hypothetical protein
MCLVSLVSTPSRLPQVVWQGDDLSATPQDERTFQALQQSQHHERGEPTEYSSQETYYVERASRIGLDETTVKVAEENGHRQEQNIHWMPNVMTNKLDPLADKHQSHHRTEDLDLLRAEIKQADVPDKCPLGESSEKDGVSTPRMLPTCVSVCPRRHKAPPRTSRHVLRQTCS